MLNENMILSDQREQLFIWINPNILENKVKIYLPSSSEGEQAMMRSIISFFKLWLRCDYDYLSQVSRLVDLMNRLGEPRTRQIDGYRPKYSH